MLQYIFFIYSSTIKKSNDESNNENYCFLYQNQEEYFLKIDFTKIYNSQNFGQDDAYFKTRDGNKICMPYHSEINSDSKSHEPLDLSNKAMDLTQESEENNQNNTVVETRSRKMTCMSLHPCKKPKLMLNESENPVSLDFSSKVIDLTQESEENNQNNTRIKIRARKKSCMPFHPCKKPMFLLNESENSKTLDFGNEATRLNQKLEENSQNDLLKNESEKSLSENITSTLQNLSEITSKHSDARDKKDFKKLFDPTIKKYPFEILADQILKFQNEFLGNNQNVIFYNMDAIQKFQELQESYKTLDLKGKLSALNSFIKKEFKYDRRFIINFFKTYSNPKQEESYNNSRKILILRKNSIRFILSSKVSDLKDLISKSLLKQEIKEYLLDYIEFIKIRLEHIKKLMPDHRLTPENIIILLYWYMRFFNESNILDNLFDLVSLQQDFVEKKIELLLSNKNFIAFSNCFANYLTNKEFYINVCINHTMFGVIKKN